MERARSGNGPTFLEMKTYQIQRTFHESDAQHYRTKDEVAEYKKIDPITQILDIIQRKGLPATADEIKAVEKDV